MYEESAGIPMIMAGPDVPAGKVCDTPVTLADGFPTFIQALGAKPDPRDRDLPGASLLEIAQGRVAGAHDTLRVPRRRRASPASYMIRHGRFKYIHYVGTAADAVRPRSRSARAEGSRSRTGLQGESSPNAKRRLREVVDPEAVDRQARADQRMHIEKNGGKEAILKRGHVPLLAAAGSEGYVLPGMRNRG